MERFFEKLIEGLGPQDIQHALRSQDATDEQAETAFGAAVSTILRGLEQKTKSQEGANGMWDVLRKQVEQGNIPGQLPGKDSGVVVRDLDPNVTDEILKGIFGDQAKNVQSRFGKVVVLDDETTKKIMGAILPKILGGLFGQAEEAPQESSQALPEILADARKQLEASQPKSGGLFDAILDLDHDGDVDLSDLVGVFRGK
jgi:hypothetical protein